MDFEAAPTHKIWGVGSRLSQRLALLDIMTGWDLACAASRLFREGFLYYKAGIGLLDLAPKTHAQIDLFTAGQTTQSKELMGVLDSINAKVGRGALFLAAEGTEKKWLMRQNLKSPNYTTSWSELPRVKWI